MTKYDFPQISHINDVLPHIEGRDEFRVMQKDWYTVINYMVALEDTFPSVSVAGGSPKMRQERALQNAMLRECRGLIFDSKTGSLLSRPYHKFFNVNEKPETHFNQVDLSEPHYILEKLDGSMIRPIRIPKSNGDFRLGTKAGVTDVAMNAEVWVAQHPNYVEFIRLALLDGFTPIFEWCSRKNRIVVDYPVDRLVLTAMRDSASGTYLPYSPMKHRAEGWDIDLVRVIGSDAENIEDLVDTIRAWEGEEGVVIRFEDARPRYNPSCGHMMKIKADAYITLHRSKDAISNEKNIINLIVNDNVDDLIPILTESDAQRLRDFQRAFWFGVDEVASTLVDEYLAEGVNYEEQREFALQFVANQPKNFHPFMYGLRKGKSAKSMLIDYISRSVTSQGKIDSARWMWGSLTWSV